MTSRRVPLSCAGREVLGEVVVRVRGCLGGIDVLVELGLELTGLTAVEAVEVLERASIGGD